MQCDLANGGERQRAALEEAARQRGWADYDVEVVELTKSTGPPEAR